MDFGVGRRAGASASYNADMLLFPSLAEGSAKIVFDALAAGCYMITTKNAGSIVQHDVHGALIEPDDVHAIQSAARRAAADRQRVVTIGRKNDDEIRRDRRQSQYGEKLLMLYEELLTTQQLTPSLSPLSQPYRHATTIATNGVRRDLALSMNGAVVPMDRGRALGRSISIRP